LLLAADDRGLAHVPGEVEVGVAHGHGVVQVERHPHDAPTPRRQLVETRRDMGTYVVERQVGVGAGEHPDGHRVHRLARHLHVEEAGVLAAESVHQATCPWGRVGADGAYALTRSARASCRRSASAAASGTALGLVWIANVMRSSWPRTVMLRPASLATGPEKMISSIARPCRRMASRGARRLETSRLKSGLRWGSGSAAVIRAAPQ